MDEPDEGERKQVLPEKKNSMLLNLDREVLFEWRVLRKTSLDFEEVSWRFPAAISRPSIIAIIDWDRFKLDQVESNWFPGLIHIYESISYGFYDFTSDLSRNEMNFEFLNSENGSS